MRADHINMHELVDREDNYLYSISIDRILVELAGDGTIAAHMHQGLLGRVIGYRATLRWQVRMRAPDT